MGKLTLDEQDLLDAEGVAIWNRSGEFRSERDSGKDIFGASGCGLRILLLDSLTRCRWSLQ